MSPYKLDQLIEIIVDNLTGIEKCIEKIILYGPYSRKDFSVWAKPYPLSRTFLREREKQQFLPEPLLLSFY